MPTNDKLFLIMPCPICQEEFLIELAKDDATDGLRAPGLIDIMNEHVISVHDQRVSGN